VKAVAVESSRIRSAWEGRVSGCMLGKPVEMLSLQQRRAGRIGLNLAGFTELRLDDVVSRTIAVAQSIGEQHEIH